MSEQDILVEEGISKEKLQKLRKAWQDADSTDTANSFYLDPDQDKIISFKISRAEVDQLLDAAGSAAKQYLELKVIMAIDTQNTSNLSISEPTFRPILSLLKKKRDSVYQSEIYLEMDYLDMDIITYLDSIVKRTHTEIPINSEKALEFITTWTTLPKDSITSVMYESARMLKNQRVKYYIFSGATDVQKLLTDLNNNKEYILYLHLGLKQNNDIIPFCPILHIDNPANFKSTELHYDASNPPMFEFSLPCPKYCGNSGG
jgi:hypothetical protein